MVLWMAHGVLMGAGGQTVTPGPVPSIPSTGAGQ